MSTLFLTHADCAAHNPGPGHPERPERLHAIWAGLSDRAFEALVRREAPLGERAAIERVHTAAHADAIFDAVPTDRRAWIDPDTAMSPRSGEAALRAVGAACAAVDAVAAGEVKNAFCAVRPPGHHAEPDQAMGFCLFNNVAVAALHARAAHGWRRVAVVDFDVHHGNGTQAAFWDDADAFYASSHQMPAYPGTGAPSERGGHGNVVNVALPPGAGSASFRAAYTGTILPRLAAFRPDALFVSAGFDAHARDPLAQLTVGTDDFAWVSRQLAQAAAELCQGRLVSVLEGGYDLDALRDSVAVHVAALMAA